MMNKKGRTTVFVLLASLMMALAGCQLAQEGIAGEEARRVGVFITAEHLDLIDRSEGVVIPVRRGRPDFSVLSQSGRLYARWDDTVGEFLFPDVDGIPFFTALTPNDVNIFQTGVGISSRGNHVFITDNSTHAEMEGTIYIVPGAQAMSVIHTNPVYQTACGRVFLTTGNGFSGHGLDTEGRVLSTTTSSSTTTTENRVENTNSISITVNLYSMFAPTKIVLLQMNEYSHVVIRTEFAPEEMPEALYMEEDTAYVIIETHRDRPHAQEQVVRELVAQSRHERQRILTFMAREDGVLVENWTEIVWDD